MSPIRARAAPRLNSGKLAAETFVYKGHYLLKQSPGVEQGRGRAGLGCCRFGNVKLLGLVNGLARRLARVFYSGVWQIDLTVCSTSGQAKGRLALVIPVPGLNHYFRQ